jgi:hypothetical protein
VGGYTGGHHQLASCESIDWFPEPWSIASSSLISMQILLIPSSSAKPPNWENSILQSVIKPNPRSHLNSLEEHVELLQLTLFD